ncbi:MAG: Ribonuclease [Candidatus Kaiserbacteria bacterium]|nr:Ribonuclease [Candidatus Kaiserbacteria bacterium]
MSDVIIFTDGASKGNPGKGGWGAIVADREKVRELGGSEANTTNNRMELQAVYEALAYTATLSTDHIDIYLDSSYVMNGARSWGSGWRRNGWITSTKQPVLNRDLWEPMLDLIDTIEAPIKWINVGGHVGIAGNERVDVIASDSALGKAVELYDGPRAAYTVDISNVTFDEKKQKEKSDSRARAKLKAYSYVSEVDGKVEVHKTWGECEARVRGKKARFKKAVSAEEEKGIVRDFS